jgi:hyperosmotically inducible periplasmic protein
MPMRRLQRRPLNSKGHPMNIHRTTTVAALALLLAASLAACSDSNKTVGEKIDATVASTERKADEVKADIKEGAADAKDAAAKATASAKQMVSDATITTSVNAELAKDSKLSALKINVDSKDGRVALMGSAPDAAARAHATQLAAAVDGVKSVDNQLTIR